MNRQAAAETAFLNAEQVPLNALMHMCPVCSRFLDAVMVIHDGKIWFVECCGDHLALKATLNDDKKGL